MAKKILIIKLGALGDVVRTLSVLPAIKSKYPDSEITWITRENALSLLEGNPHVNYFFSIPIKLEENYDLIYNFDTEEEATTIAESTNAREKLGFFSQDGFPMAYNPEAEYYLNTMFDDELKKSNKKTYQEMMFNLARLEWKKQKPFIFLSDKDRSYAINFIKNKNLKKEKIIGIHMGASSRWPSKVWHKKNLEQFIMRSKLQGYDILLFGGPNEITELESFSSNLEKKGIKIIINNPHNTIKEFSALVSLCNCMVCSDSFALHISLSLGIKTIGLFFCTSPEEIEGYNLLKKIISPKLKDFFPERSDEYSEELTQSISAEEVFLEI